MTPLELSSATRESVGRTLLESTLDATVIIDTTGSIVHLNAPAETLFDYRRHELVGQPVEVLVPQRFRCRSDHRNYFEEPWPCGMEPTLGLYGLRKGGDEFATEMIFRPVDSVEGLLVSGPIRDLTERRRTEAKFRGLVESSSDAVVIASEPGTIVLANAHAERLFGCTRAELVGRPVRSVLPKCCHEPYSALVGGRGDAARPRRMDSAECVAVRHNGELIPVEVQLNRLEAEDGFLISVSFHDVTDRRPADLGAEVADAERQKEALAKGRFLSTVGHELRTPLNAIIGFLGIILMRLPGPLTADQDEQLQIVQSSAKHLLLLINDLVDLGKIEFGTVVCDAEPVLCQPVLSDVVEALRPAAEGRGLTLELTMPASTVTVRADRRALHQILLNLTNHAIRCAEIGPVRLELSQPGADARDVEIRVIAAGMDVHPDDEDQLFKAFAPLRGPSPSDRGTGVGLHLSQEQAKLLGGSLRWSSEVADGHAFVLGLPRS